MKITWDNVSVTDEEQSTRRDVQTAIELQERMQYRTETELIQGIEYWLNWNSNHAREIAELAWVEMYGRRVNQMSRVTFVPKVDTRYQDGWPEKVIGDGFIDLQLDEIIYGEDRAIYVDNFRDEYEFWCSSDREWTVEVRED